MVERTSRNQRIQWNRNATWRSWSLPVLVLIAVLSGCATKTGGVTKTGTEKKVDTEERRFTGDWYDEYEDEVKKQKPDKATKELYHRPKDCIKAARAAMNHKEFERAVRLADAAIQQDSESGEAYFLRGRSTYYSAFGEEKDARFDLEKARELGYKQHELYDILAKLYDAKKQYDKALEAVSCGIEICPDKELYRCRGALYQTLGKNDLALADLNEYVRLVPKKSIGYCLRGSLYQHMERDEDALRDYATAVKIDPANTHVLTATAMLLTKHGKNKEALEALSKVADVDHYDDDCLRLRGNIYFSMKQYERAVADYTRAIKLSPSYARATLEARSKAYEKLGRMDLADNDRAEAKKQFAGPAERPVYQAN